MADAVICPSCDYILDTSFLGEDILNQKTIEHAVIDASASEDALVVGDISDDAELLFNDSTGSFLTADTVDIVRRIAPVKVYASKSVQEMLAPQAVLGPAPDIEKRKSALSPFELHVLSFLDGARPVARVCKKAGLSIDDVRIALAMLIDKKAAVLVGTVQKPHLKDLLSDDEDLLGGDTVEDASLPVEPHKKKSGDWIEPQVQVAPMPEQPPAASPWQGEATTKRLAEREQTVVQVQDRLYSHPQPKLLDVEKREAQQRAAGFFELAHSELQKGNRVRAHMYARLAAETDPEEPRYQELLKTWASAARAVQSTEGALIADADLAERQGNVHKAIALLQEAVEKNPKNAAVHNRLGLLLALKLKQYNKAAEHVMTAVELDADNVAYKNNLGKIIALAEERGAVVARKALHSKSDKGGLLGKLKKAFD
jgi:hypothetical protein